LQVQKEVDSFRSNRRKLCEILGKVLSIEGTNRAPSPTPAAPIPVAPAISIPAAPAVPKGEWPVLAVGTTLAFDRLNIKEHITILVRVPAATSLGKGSNVWVSIPHRTKLLSSPVTQITRHFYSPPSPAVEFQQMGGMTEVVDGLGWLTLKRPASFRSGELCVPDGALVALCIPINSPLLLPQRMSNKEDASVRKTQTLKNSLENVTLIGSYAFWAVFGLEC